MTDTGAGAASGHARGVDGEAERAAHGAGEETSPTTGWAPGEGEAVAQPHAEPTGEAAHAAAPSGHGWSTDAFLAPATPAFTFLDQPDGDPSAVDDEDDLLLMPAPQGSWGDPQPVPAQPAPPVTPAAPPQPVVPAPAEPEPVAVDPASVPQDGEQHPDAADFAAPPATSTSGTPGQAAAPRRPLNMGPPAPVGMPHPAAEAVGGVSVRSLAERGPAPAPTAAAPVHQPEPRPMPEAEPEYVDASAEQAAAIPAQQSGESPVSGGPWVAAEAPAGAAVDGTPAAGTPAAGTPAAGMNVAEPVGPVPGDASVPGAEAPVAGETVAAAPVAAEAAVAGAADAAVPVEGPVPGEPVVAEAAVPAAAAGPVPAPAEAPAPVPAEAPAHAAAEAPAQAATEAPAQAAAEAPAQAAAEPEVPAAAPEESPAAPDAETPAQPQLTEPVAEAQPTPLVGTPVTPPVVAEPLPGSPEHAPADEPGGLADLDREPVAPSAPVLAQTEPVAEPAPNSATEADISPETPASDVVAPQQPTAEEPATEADTVEQPAAEPQTAPEAQEAEQPTAAEPAPASGGVAAGYDEAVREAVHRVIRERRDIRNGFRPDPIPHEVLLRVLEAAHTAPSVGHSQPWDFVVIRSTQTREKMHALAMKQREAYAKSLPKARAKQFRELKIEAILETPVNIVVTADPTRGGRHTLGRHTQPQMAPYSSALAVENLWLAARAEGLGVGWVSFFDEREMVRELGLPEHLEVVAYLCVGYVDEFPEEPELMQAGWSKRRPLSWVVHEEEYGRRALPGEQPHDLLDETLRGIRPLDAKALGEAWERQKRMTKPSGALGMLEIISAQLCGLSRQCPPPIPEPAAVAIFAGDHGVHAQGVTAWPQEVTAQMVANFLGGGAVCNAFANQVGAEVCVVDVGVAAELPTTPGLLPRKVRHGTADFTTGPAMTREDALRAIEVGIETARDLVAAGNKALLTGEMGIANTTASAALIAVYTGADPAEVTGRGTGINDEMHARKVDVVRRALELHRPDPTDPIGVLSALGGLEHAAMVGLVLGGASLRTPVILDGVSAGAAALVARAIAPEALAACIAGHRSAEPGHMAALTKLGLRPLVDLDLRLGEGTGALLALPLVQSAARVMHEVATFDSAGVTEKD
ncbi:nicotinate-nucleotide--dimethylbenzimidazole phosphoribosyltransferase [Streptantibioticus rubrisoli]|uniref:Nicotinate-nucleotide--dimethylbenzimidazole phosphoribosyltransferase n=1 Tax=Streptantibioticus rubrisoli TaxID=1387313 RepID=A0ABT1PGR4_9ACTN|nr:nicotinate-nucleotide--dimethylbenzimidazole phosphoribosyltransferase [Streptantibioticus rubrisoli]MCQ4043500.1 nicotinate-nucleotide--dimethylbenzimidazole phosphoribosyltransferase [Streptantibioticus rubrisoli]